MSEPGTKTPALEVQGLSKSYGPLKALDEVSLIVAGGEFVGLLGPNGAGKTTLFQILSGLFVADAGSVDVLGHDIRHSATAALAGIGVVFQQSTLDLDLRRCAPIWASARGSTACPAFGAASGSRPSSTGLGSPSTRTLPRAL